jgi:surface antigen
MRTSATHQDHIVEASALAFAVLGLACAPASQTCEDSLDCARGEVCLAQVCTLDEESSPGLDPEERANLGEGLGAGNEPTDYGAVIDAFCGIEARQNGPDPAWTPGYEATYGYEYQCTELAFRFICQYFDMCTSKTQPFGNAKYWFDNTKGNPVLAQLTRYDNGGAEPPRPGDVLVSTSGGFGHVAVVKWIDQGFVYVLEQNAYQGSHRYAISESGGKYTMSAGWRGWMRAPGGPADCQEIPSTCGCEGTLDTTSIVDGKLSISGMVHCPAGIDKWSIAVQEEVVFSDFPTDQTIEFSELIDLSNFDFTTSNVAVGLWARPAGGDACLLDDEALVVEGDDCTATSNTQCAGNTVVHVDSCGELGEVAEVCSGDAVCVDVTPTSAECQIPLETCGNGNIDPGEQCDGSNLGGATCENQGYGTGVLACTACTFDASECVDLPNCSYSVSPESPNSSYTAPYTCPGGIVMPISGSLSNDGYLTVSSPGKPGDYGSGTYRVLVFDPNDPVGDQCKPWNVVKSTFALNSTANSITFPAFDSLLTCGSEKAYCIVKEDGGSIAHFCSGKLVADYQ